MVGQRGETPLVPPYRLLNFKWDAAVGAGPYRLSKFLRVGIVQPTSRAGGFQFLANSMAISSQSRWSARNRAGYVLGFLRHSLQKDMFDVEIPRTVIVFSPTFPRGETVVVWSREFRSRRLRRFTATGSTTESSSGRSGRCSSGWRDALDAGDGWCSCSRCSGSDARHVGIEPCRIDAANAGESRCRSRRDSRDSGCHESGSHESRRCCCDGCQLGSCGCHWSDSWFNRPRWV